MVSTVMRRTMASPARTTSIACVVRKRLKKTMESGLNLVNVWEIVGQIKAKKPGPKSVNSLQGELIDLAAKKLAINMLLKMKQTAQEQTRSAEVFFPNLYLALWIQYQVRTKNKF